MTDDLTDLEALAQAATPGPWRWRNTQEVYLLGDRSKVVMAFRRMGMNGAQPEFRGADGLLFPAGRENLHAIPDAAYIAAVHPGTILALLDRLEKAEAGRDNWRDKAQEAGAAYGLANSKHHEELDRANRLERLADTLAGKAVDLEDRAREAEAERDEARAALALAVEAVKSRREAFLSSPDLDPAWVAGWHAASDDALHSIHAALAGGDDRG